MSYVQSFTDNLLKIVDKKNLEVWVQNLNAKFTLNALDDGFEKEIIINFVIKDEAIDDNKLLFFIQTWLQKHVPDWETQGNRWPQLTIIPLQDGKSDIEGVIELKEMVTLEDAPKGDWIVDGVKKSLKSDFSEQYQGVDDLVVFDSHTQDSGLEN